MKHVDGMRMNHVEITVPVGSFARMRADLVAFYGDALGFGVNTIDAFGPNHVFLVKDAAGSNFIYVAEHERPLVVGGDDHVGFHVPDPAAVDAILAECRRVQARDPRMEIRELEDIVLPTSRTHAFYFRYLLPLWFDIQHVALLPG